MTESTATPGPTRATRPLYRDPNDDMVVGVCAGIARYTNTDPVIWRIVIVVLALFGGTGIALYVLGWILIPKLGADRSIAESWLGRREGRLGVRTMALIAIAAIVIIGGLDDGRGLAAAAVLGLVGYLVYRERDGRPLAPSFAGPAQAQPQPVTAPMAWAPPERAPRERSRLGLFTLSLAALVTGTLAWAATAGADGLTPGRVTAVALVIVGAGLVVGTWYGRARWLIAVGLLLCLGLGTAAAADATGGTLRGGLGERTWVVGEGASRQGFDLGVGEATLDLTALAGSGQHVVVEARVGLGHLIILVPDDVPIRVHATARIGEIREFDRTLVSSEHRVERTRSYGPDGDPRVEVEANVGTGQVEVRHG